MKRRFVNFFVAILLLAVASGCGTTVERMDVNSTKDLSGKWNDTDSRLVSTETITQALEGGWLKKFRRNEKRDPVVIVGVVKNKSHEHINVETFVKDLERALVNSGEVEFVASKDERAEIREERREQASHSSTDTAKQEGEEVGADFMLSGTINTIMDKIGGKHVMFYQINLELIHIETHKKVWIGDKKIKKFVKRSRVRF
ncbi:MAG: penicillin-binding protein activator LpoB [Deltaproteobacteria bacterium]|nr:penicillin-binding protein activator LpoB [Deltaproteobacteria bacterium]